MIKLSKDAFQFNNWYLFLLYTVATVVIAYAFTTFVIKDEMYYNSLGDRLSTERIKEILDSQRKFRWLGYLLLPLKIVIKVAFTAGCLYLGSTLLNYYIGFAAFFKISLFAEMVFIIGSTITVAIQLLLSRGNSFEDLANLDYFSLYALLRPADFPSFLSYPLQVVNVFEIVYWIVLAASVQVFLQKSFSKAFGVVLSTYGIGLLCWIMFVVFMTINFSS